ncbi:hypothetical protein OH76DRAFT_1021835 [Lentinus brumalis]|uniref:Fe2OG dioxygenase domain-containing protein n=1 Tax=Lentinus brumalis TaxID=2498619 RepID=A0A371CXX4_9APHY|nr:hypothetical protein OH76DRAFT_1021835 [Polyporus brumalis]
MPDSTATSQSTSHTSAGLRRKHSDVQPPSPTLEPQAPPTKRHRGRAGQTLETSEDPSTVAEDIQPFESEATGVPVTQEFPPVALKLIYAIKESTSIPSIGYSPTQLDKEAKNMMSYGPQGLTKDQVDTDLKLSKEEVAREKHNSAIIAKLSDIYAQHVHNKASGYLDKPFKLQITRPTCKFDGEMVPPAGFHRKDSPKFAKGEKTAISKRLRQWYKDADVSGYGDVREQVTKVDETVRKAREIPATQFSVEPELLERIARLWDQHFYPNRGIRVEPYKIHLYGPGGRFGAHRDTPQKDLIGTFLLGLGDSSGGGGLVVDGKEMPAHVGHWCAFYPDVPHRVDEIWNGHRAVVAFKIFRTAGIGAETETTTQVRQEATELMSQMQAPFGIMLERKYCLGTTELSGFDALLLQSALTLPNVDVKHFPVVLRTNSSFGSHDEYDCTKDFEMSCNTAVVPFTRGHIEKLFEVDGEGMPSHTECGCPWLAGVKNVPFFSLELPRSLHPCSKEQEETCNYTGNEAQAWREDSVYLSYALLVLRKADSDAKDRSKGTGGK